MKAISFSLLFVLISSGFFVSTIFCTPATLIYPHPHFPHHIALVKLPPHHTLPHAGLHHLVQQAPFEYPERTMTTKWGFKSPNFVFGPYWQYLDTKNILPTDPVGEFQKSNANIQNGKYFSMCGGFSYPQCKKECSVYGYKSHVCTRTNCLCH